LSNTREILSRINACCRRVIGAVNGDAVTVPEHAYLFKRLDSFQR
jgi:hypothetical protein